MSLRVRVIVDVAAAGAWNMAVDEALLASANEGATLRFYLWEPATLSLGYFQSAADRAAHGASRSCPLVRRASGGGAIVHDRELTYSFVVPTSRVHQQALACYDAFHRSLVATLRDWGVAAALFAESNGPAGNEGAFLCFQRRTEKDIVVAGQKIVGSAQRKQQQALLQHGSILLQQSPQAPELPGIYDLLGRERSASELIEQWLPPLSSALNATLLPGELTPAEMAAAEAWQRNRFAADAWTHKR